ncbi:thioredoxin reductase (NADPH) [Jatrophihabitans endophyticus]|uniref:Ferredoxin--NADP reductase n=1 Tax=Jatrophihabitans endophyticus TaxID=1206085 RepID=A0A1M5GHI4_9ACTN|nr:NAD(P)/FAD-dependent oxidoreductase [Jatrophihabitans endophyticus]SHG03148.1 thioredoxin reductase (NADPH) [Jatrophihabitans endophyticus]
MTSASVKSVDLLIVGAGPVGLFGAYYAGVRTLSTAVLDSLEEPGGQITAMYPEKAIFDVAGFPAIRGRELVDQLLAQAAPFAPHYLLGHQAVGLERGAGDGAGAFAVTTATGHRIECRAIVVTGGIGTFTPRPLPVGGEYLGRGLVHFVPEPEAYRGRDIVVVGGGDSALDWALMLEPIGRSVTVVHRRAEFRAHQHSVELMRTSSVRVITDAQVTAVHGDPDVDGVEVTVNGGAEVVPVACDRLIAALGFTANLGPLMEWGIDIRKRQIMVATTGQTSVPGIYAAGDIVDYEGKVKLIATGFGEVATAINNAYAFLNPGKSAFPGHLSDYAPAPTEPVGSSPAAR